jgi:hypothetical protein
MFGFECRQGICTSVGHGGEPCTNNGHCYSGGCNSGICGAYYPEDAGCANNGWNGCAAGFCDNGTCRTCN